MAVVIRRIIDQYYYLMEASDPRVEHLPLMSSPLVTCSICLFYVYFTTSLGQKFMANRPAFDCKNLMILYNIAQIFFNGLFVYQAFRYIWIPMNHNFLCEEVDYSYDPLALKIVNYCWLYFITKVLDLLDTIFMVLRKKNNQITFLHVYHHSGMAFAGWVTVKFIPGGYVTFFGTVNALVHTVMYTYYLITALYPEYKNNIWWKRHITEFQLVQFVITTLHGLVNLFNPNCNFPKLILAIFVPQDIFMFLMFWDFYKKTYLKKESKQS